jgi:CHAT domain-containing protein
VALARRGHIDRARRAFSAALAAKMRYLDGQSVVTSLVAIGNCDLERGRKDQVTLTLAKIESELARERAGRPDDDVARPLVDVATLYAQTGRPEKALETIRKAMPAVRARSGREALTTSLLIQARCEFACGELADARRSAVEAFTLARKHAAEIDWMRVGEWQRYTMPVLEFLLKLHSGEEDAQASLGFVEAVKAMSLRSAWGRTIDAPPDFPEDLRKRERDLLSNVEIDEWLSYEELGGNEGLHRKFAEDARAKLNEFWRGLPAPWRQYGACRSGDMPGIADLLDTLPKGEVTFVWLHPTQDAVRIWVRDLEGKLSRCLAAIDEKSLRTTIEQTLLAVEEQRSIPGAWYQQSALLTGPWISQVPPESTICFIPSGSLLELPVPLLDVDGAPLVNRNPTVILPTAALPGIWQFQPRLDRAPAALVIGDSLNDLPHSRTEAIEVAARWDVTPRLGAEVMRWSLDGDLAHRVDLLHIATHAFFRTDHADLSGFMLADGTVFSARDLRRRRLRARLCILSACSSGRLDVRAGDELRGLVSGVLMAGTRSVIATSWEVADAATADLVRSFYDALKHKDLANALRTAQLELSSQPERGHPFYLAAFRLFGDWRRPWA